MAWLFSCKACGYHIVSKSKHLAEIFMAKHKINSHPHFEDILYDEEKKGFLTVYTRVIPNGDYEVMKNIPNLPALVL